MKPRQPNGSPPTLGDVRWVGARSLLARCMTCPHEDIIDVTGQPDSAPLSTFAARFVCRRCGRRGAYVLPNWTDAKIE
jgi:hypothetical protein